jgi:hypothetical protein
VIEREAWGELEPEGRIQDLKLNKLLTHIYQRSQAKRKKRKRRRKKKRKRLLVPLVMVYRRHQEWKRRQE